MASALGIPGLLGLDFPNGFTAEHPDVSVTLNELPDSMCAAVVRDGLYDLALTVLPVEREFHTLELYSSPVLYWVRRDDPLAKKDSLDIHDLDVYKRQACDRRLALFSFGVTSCGRAT